MNDYLLSPEIEVKRWLDENGANREDANLKGDVLLCTPALFNAFTNCARRWEVEVENLPVVWEPGAHAGVVRAVSVKVETSEFSVYRILSSAPMATTQLEMLIAMGARRLLFLGEAEPISPDLSAGQLIVPSFAVREDGISDHYLKGDKPSRPDEVMRSEIVGAAGEMGVDIITAGVWSSGAVFRRSKAWAEELLLDGVAAVETEVAALFAVAAFRNVSLGALVVIDDSGVEDSCRIGMKVMCGRNQPPQQPNKDVRSTRNKRKSDEGFEDSGIHAGSVRI